MIKEKQVHLFILLGFIILFAAADYVMLEQIYHPLSSSYDIAWSEFYVSTNVQFIWWHIIFIPLVIITFVLVGLAAKSWKLGLSGIILFATGWEDIFYYLIQGSWLPAQLPWLNWSPIMTLTRYITQTEHVSGVGVTISAIIGGLIVYFMYYPEKYEILKKKLSRK